MVDFRFTELKCFFCKRPLPEQFLVVQVGDNIILIHKGNCAASVWDRKIKYAVKVEH